MSVPSKIILDFSIPWTYAEAAYFLRIAEVTLRDKIKQKKPAPPRIKVGGGAKAPVLFWPQDVVDWLQSQKIPPDDPKPGRPRKK